MEKYLFEIFKWYLNILSIKIPDIANQICVQKNLIEKNYNI